MPRLLQWSSCTLFVSSMLLFLGIIVSKIVSIPYKTTVFGRLEQELHVHNNLYGLCAAMNVAMAI